MKPSLLLLLAAIAGPALAALGGAPSTLGGGTALSAALPQASAGAAAVTAVTRTLESGTEVRQYLDARGTVVAVSWSGPALPDLKDLLGPYFQALLDERAQHPGARGPVRIQRGDIVIESGGRMGAFQGRAWLPAQLPAGFSSNDIR